MTPKTYRLGDLVEYRGYQYVVVKRNRDGMLRLMGVGGAPPYVRTMVAPTKVTLLEAAARIETRSPADPEDRVRLGVLLREVRLSLGYSTTGLAEILAVSQSHLSRLERGAHHARASVAFLERFADVTGADEDVLCAAAGHIPSTITTSLRSVDNLKDTRLLLAKHGQHGESQAV
jgi:transcriptional regulator with XRE-family HTH domain